MAATSIRTAPLPLRPALLPRRVTRVKSGAHGAGRRCASSRDRGRRMRRGCAIDADVLERVEQWCRPSRTFSTRVLCARRPRCVGRGRRCDAAYMSSPRTRFADAPDRGGRMLLVHCTSSSKKTRPDAVDGRRQREQKTARDAWDRRSLMREAASRVDARLRQLVDRAEEVRCAYPRRGMAAARGARAMQTRARVPPIPRVEGTSFTSPVGTACSGRARSHQDAVIGKLAASERAGRAWLPVVLRG